MARIELTPSEIFFSQDSIKNRFGDNTHHRNTLIRETLDAILSDKCSISDIPLISVVRISGKWVTADNRRLWVFKELQKLGKCDKITAIVINYLNPKKNCVQSTTRVRQSGYVGGSFWRTLENQINAGVKPVQFRDSIDETGCSNQRNVLLDSTKKDSSEVNFLYDSDTSSRQLFSSDKTKFDNYYSRKRSIRYSEKAFSIPMDSAEQFQGTNSNRSNKIRRTAISHSSFQIKSFQGTKKHLLTTDKTVSDKKSAMSNTKYVIPVSHFQDNSTSKSSATSIDNRPILYLTKPQTSPKLFPSEKLFRCHSFDFEPSVTKRDAHYREFVSKFDAAKSNPTIYSNCNEISTKSLSSENLLKVEDHSFDFEQKYHQKEFRPSSSSNAATGKISPTSDCREKLIYEKTKEFLVKVKTVRSIKCDSNTPEKVVISRPTVSKRDKSSLEFSVNTLAAVEKNPILNANCDEKSTKYLSSENSLKVERHLSCQGVFKQNCTQVEPQSSNNTNAANGKLSSGWRCRYPAIYQRTLKESSLKDKVACSTNNHTSEKIVFLSHTVLEKNVCSLKGNVLVTTEASKGNSHTHGSRKYPAKLPLVEGKEQSRKSWIGY